MNNIQHSKPNNKQQELTEDSLSSDLLDLYGAATDLEFAVDTQGISDEMDDDFTEKFDVKNRLHQSE